MSYTKEQIIVDISAYMRQEGGAKSEWYVGVASDPRDKLFNGDHVREKSDCWIYRQGASSSMVRKIASAYLDGGYYGGLDGEDPSAVYVYAYRRTSGTNP